jgi:signal transduction histidine kinase
LLRVHTHLTLRRQQLELERQKQELQELNRDKSEFFSIAAHDLKNPLNSLSLLMDALLNNLLPPEQQQGYFEIARACIDRMTIMVNQLLNIDRIESNRITARQQPVNLSKLLQNVIFHYRQQAEAKQIKLQLEFGQAGQEYIAVADEALCFDVFDNLVSNAVKYTPLM